MLLGRLSLPAVTVMRRILLALGMALYGLVYWFGTAEPELSNLCLEYDFGVVVAGSDMACDLEVRNIGRAPLRLGKPRSGCSCRKVIIDKDILGPGEKSNIHVSFDPRALNGRFRHRTLVPTNIQSDPWLSIILSGEVQRRVKTPQGLDLSSGALTFDVSCSEPTFRITDASAPNGFELKQSDLGGGTWRFDLSILGWDPARVYETEFVKLRTNQPGEEVILIPVFFAFESKS